MAIDNLKKHVGLLNNTGVRIAVVFRQIPTDPTFCLIVETERLPDSYHDYMVQCANSKEAVETNNFYEVLSRRTFPDGLNCLTALHQRGFLRKEPVTNVTMIPLPGQKVPLELINATIDKKVDAYMAKQTAEKMAIPAAEAIEAGADPVAVAKGLILQADILEADATAKREEAYALAPELKPGRGRPATPENLKAQIIEERKVKRLERDRANAALAKIEKRENEIDAKIAAKIQRDTERVNTPMEPPKVKVKSKKVAPE